MKLDKALRRERKQKRRKHGMKVDKKPTDLQNAIIKRGRLTADSQ
jgi:hypothetical protein